MALILLLCVSYINITPEVDNTFSIFMYVFRGSGNDELKPASLEKLALVGNYTPPGWDFYCSPCRLYGPTYRSSPHIPQEEVMWQVRRGGYLEVIQTTSSGGYVDNLLGRLCKFLIFENYCTHSFPLGTFGSESQCCSTELS